MLPLVLLMVMTDATKTILQDLPDHKVVVMMAADADDVSLP